MIHGDATNKFTKIKQNIEYENIFIESDDYGQGHLGGTHHQLWKCRQIM